MMRRMVCLVLIVLSGCLMARPSRAVRPINPEAKGFRFSTTIEKERPVLDQETKDCIAAWRRDPSQANYDRLKAQVERNYDQVIARKVAKLEELKQTARHRSKVEEMEQIVEETIANRALRIKHTMARFTDARFRPGYQTPTEGYVPVLGSKAMVDIAVTPVTQGAWAAFTGKPIVAEKAKLPVVGVTFREMKAYCVWLEKQTPQYRYRLPTEEEWMLAAGHMPKDAAFNCGLGCGITPVDTYQTTKGACGGYDFWGNCWEWTMTRKESGFVVKGGAHDASRLDCRTEATATSRNPNQRYANVTFRLIRETLQTR